MGWRVGPGSLRTESVVDYELITLDPLASSEEDLPPGP